MLGTEEDRIRFVLEAQAAAALDHSNICTVHEIDEAEGKTFIAMAYVDGESLQEKIESGPLHVDEALDIAIQVAEGLRRAHRRGIIHRDIKSANIMVTDEGQVKIMDFGLAKLKGRTRLTRTATIMGTVTYMSPEQASGEATIDLHTDIWSLGVVLYKMLTGSPPFDAPSDAALIHKIIYEEPEPISSLRGDIPPALEGTIHKMLQKNPQERYEDMAAVLSDLRAIRAGAAPKTVIEEKGVPSIAVLPFIDMSPHKDQEYFCDGISESLINELTQLSDLKVIARTSAFSFKGQSLDVRDIGRKLDVQTVLEGSVRKAGNRLRITAQLVDTTGGHHLWSEQYNREMDDVFAIQDEISEAIVEKLKPKLLEGEKAKIGQRHTANIEAYDLYLKGRYFWSKMTKESLEKAIEFFKLAIDKSPDYALAYTGLADSYGYHSFYGFSIPKEFLPKMRERILRALEIDDSLGEAHASLGNSRMWAWDWKGAEEEFQRAIELNPGYAEAHHWYGHLLTLTGRPDEGIRQMELARELDPLSLPINRCVALNFLHAHEHTRAMKALQRTVELDPGYPFVNGMLGFVYLEQGMLEEAVAAFEKEQGLSKGHDPMSEIMKGAAYAIMGRAEEYIHKSQLAGFLFLLGEKEVGFEWLEKACAERDPYLLFAIMDGPSEPVRSDPRFIAVLKKMNLEP
jgi:serine/threonine protein kinase